MLDSLAKVFVHPWQIKEVVQALKDEHVELKNVHVIVSASLEHLVQLALEKIPSRQGVRQKDRRSMFSTRAKSSQCAASADTSEHEWEDERFECISRTPLTFALKKRRPKSVTQSTTEAHIGRPGINPRRFRVPDRDMSESA